MFYINPSTSHDNLPGQVPGRNDMISVNPVARVTIDEELTRAIITSAVRGASSELRMRQVVMSQLLEQGVVPRQRREILQRAVQAFRDKKTQERMTKPRKPVQKFVVTKAIIGDETMPNRPKQTSPTDDVSGNLVPQIKKLLEEHQHAGMPIEQLVDHVQKHGAPAILAALKKIKNLVMTSKRLYIKKDESSRSAEKSIARAWGPEHLFKAEKEVMPQGGQGAGGADDPRSDPVGARKIWNKRIVEKQPDGRWRVVGHIAGLEDPTAVKQLDTGLLDREHLLVLLKQLLKIHEIESGSKKTKDGKDAKARNDSKFVVPKDSHAT